jgi:hypothetical protein
LIPSLGFDRSTLGTPNLLVVVCNKIFILKNVIDYSGRFIRGDGKYLCRPSE